MHRLLLLRLGVGLGLGLGRRTLGYCAWGQCFGGALRPKVKVAPDLLLVVVVAPRICIRIRNIVEEVQYVDPSQIGSVGCIPYLLSLRALVIVGWVGRIALALPRVAAWGLFGLRFGCWFRLWGRHCNGTVQKCFWRGLD